MGRRTSKLAMAGLLLSVFVASGCGRSGDRTSASDQESIAASSSMAATAVTVIVETDGTAETETSERAETEAGADGENELAPSERAETTGNQPQRPSLDSTPIRPTGSVSSGSTIGLPSW